MILGLTGGMGCGKSVVAGLFEQIGWARVDTDQIVRDLLGGSAEAISAVRAAFGAAVITDDGEVDRRALARVVFEDRVALATLEEILHPMVRIRWKAATGRRPEVPWVVEIPLLFEKGLEKEVDFTLCIASDPVVQAQRLASRGLSPQEASQRISRQLPLAQKIERADFVIINNGSLSFLEDQVIRLASFLAHPVA